MNDFRKASEEIFKGLNEIRNNSRKSFVSGVYNIHRYIITKFYSNLAGGLKRRSGDASKSWQVKVTSTNDSISGEVFSAGVAYADFSNKKTITPKTSKWLTIPVGPALTKAGAPRYAGGARQADSQLSGAPKTMRNQRSNRSNLFFLKKDDSTAFLIAKKGVTGIGITKTNRILFILKKKVEIPAYTEGLMPFVEKRGDEIFKDMTDMWSR